jgi:hypothetical protein
MTNGLTVREIFSAAFGKQRGGQSIAMWKVYLDESGNDPNNVADAFVIAGFLGPEDAWENLTKKWADELSPLNRLHTAKFLRDKDYARGLSRGEKIRKLDNLADILKDCDLAPIMSLVGWKDYSEVVTGRVRELYSTPYMVCAQYVIAYTLKVLPPDEKVVFVFEYEERHIEAIRDFEKMLFKYSIDPRLNGILSLPKDETRCTEPADYLAYAAYQFWWERKTGKHYPSSFEAIATSPVLGNGDVVGGIANRERLSELSGRLIKNED